jgi:Ca2+-binding RTX toxin-like protein
MARIVGTENGESLAGTSDRDQILALGGNDEISGRAGADFLDGGPGEDHVFGEDGNDQIIGGSESLVEAGRDDDLLDGGSGSDWVIYRDLIEEVTIDLSQQIVTSTSQTDQLASIENATGSLSATTFIGSPENNVFVGVGDSTNFISSAGNDTYRAGEGLSSISYQADPAGIVLNGDSAEDGFGGTDRIGVKGLAHITGSEFADLMRGSSRRDWLEGAGGDDEIHGRKGSDLLTGGPGEDLIDGGSGVDWLLLDQRDDAEQVVDLGAGTATVLGEVDTLLSIENVVSSGGLAGVGIETLIGNDADNRLVSLGGDTVMTGGGGADRFQQQGGGFGNPDVITDFESGTDLLYFTPDVAFNLDFELGLLPLGPLSDELFATGSAADADDLFIFDTTTGALGIDLDGDGAGAPIELMTIANGAQIAASDIVIVPDIGTELFLSPDPVVASLEAPPATDTLLG